MRASALTLAALSLTGVTLAAVSTGRYTITARNGAAKAEYLAVKKGQLVLGPQSPRGDGGLDEKDAPDRWYVLGRKIKSSVAGLYLAYDPSGKDNHVFLTPTPKGKGTEWVVHRPEG